MANDKKRLNNNAKSKAKSKVKRKAKGRPVLSFFLVFVIVLVSVGYFIYNGYFKPATVTTEGELSFHFINLGNKNAGDCIYVKAGENDILIDAGSKANSINSITSYLDKYVTDKKLEYVIATHGHEDHIACFGIENGSIFDLYECEVIIDFPKTNVTSKLYERYVKELNDEVEKGAKHFTALECYNQSKEGALREYKLSEDGSIKMEILYNYYYDNSTSNENDNSVCVMFYHGERKYLFTGDLEKEGEERLVQKYNFGQVELYKAGHHGSNTSSCESLLREIKPKICVACCCAGNVEYTQNLENTFPSQAFINRISAYTDKVYVPVTTEIRFNESSGKYESYGELQLMNGNIVVYSNNQGVNVKCSGNDVLLKDTDWFKKYRTCPVEWKTN